MTNILISLAVTTLVSWVHIGATAVALYCRYNGGPQLCTDIEIAFISIKIESTIILCNIFNNKNQRL